MPPGNRAVGAVPRVRRVGYADAERLSAALGRVLRERFGPDLSDLAFVPIPRGGLFVLGMLSYVLDLSPSQVRSLDRLPSRTPARAAAPSRAVLVDDCALSGARLAASLDRLGRDGGRIVVAHLVSHPALRRAVEAEEPRVECCLAADDLAPLEGDYPEDFEEIWRARLPGRRYWIGPVEPVAFPWSEPEAVWWNARDGRLEREWRRVSPRSCLRFRAELDLPQPDGGPGPLDLADGVLWKQDGERVLLRSADRSGRLIGLEGVALDMWKSVIAFGDRERACRHLLELYEVERTELERDLDRLLADLLHQGFLTDRPPAGSRYRLHGLTLVSGFPFSHPLPPADPERAPTTQEVVFELAEEGRLPGERRPGEPDPGAEVVYRSPEQLRAGESVLTAVRAGAITLLRFAGVGAFSVGSDRIVARPEGPPGSRQRTLVELRLLGPVLAFWLERSGRVALHAAAVTAAERAVAFLSSNHGGKTSLAAALMALGRPMLTDDVLAVEETLDAFRGHPGSPQMRLWPEDADRLLPAQGGVKPSHRFPRVHPGFDKVRVPVGDDGLGDFAREGCPLGRLYLPERVDGAPIEIAPVPPREALMALVRHSFLPRLVAAMGWEERRLDLLARLVSNVPVRRLTYPSGHEHLPAVARAILEDLEGS